MFYLYFSMAYVVSARKYRPATFEDVVGQEQITSTLKRAIESDHIAQAFLFCGPRGVGKTTCARIMAKAVNTGQTEKLQEIKEDFSFNIFELDAASNNKVDDIRELVAQVRIPPQTGKYKIYIIDEVHMLSQAAFNAFLKTLEEPPPYAIFILATTEKHKILPTILSRCQIYDFKRISVADIVQHLKNIAENENIKAEEDALHIIAEKADGALRDALSIFDRLVSFAGDHLTYEAVVKNLNVLDFDYFFKLTNQLLMEDTSAAFLLFDEILNHGFEGDHFIHGLAAHFRNLMVCKDERTLPLLEVSDSLRERYIEQAKTTPTSFIINGLNLCSECDVRYAQSQNKRLLVELALIKIALVNRAIEGADLATEKKNLTPSKSLESAVKPKETTAENSKQETEKISHTVHQSTSPPPKKTSNSPKLNTFGKSIEDLMNADEEAINKVEEDKEEATENYSEANFIDFTSENAANIWQKLCKEIKDENPSLHDTLFDIVPVVSKTGLTIHVDSFVEKDLIEKQKPFIIGYLKTHFDLNPFEIDIIILDRPERKKILLNAKDKFELMVEKNPLIKDLKNQLGLDLRM